MDEELGQHPVESVRPTGARPPRSSRGRRAHGGADGVGGEAQHGRGSCTSFKALVRSGAVSTRGYREVEHDGGILTASQSVKSALVAWQAGGVRRGDEGGRAPPWIEEFIELKYV